MDLSDMTWQDYLDKELDKILETSLDNMLDALREQAYDKQADLLCDVILVPSSMLDPFGLGDSTKYINPDGHYDPDWWKEYEDLLDPPSLGERFVNRIDMELQGFVDGWYGMKRRACEWGNNGIWALNGAMETVNAISEMSNYHEPIFKEPLSYISTPQLPPATFHDSPESVRQGNAAYGEFPVDLAAFVLIEKGVTKVLKGLGFWDDGIKASQQATRKVTEEVAEKANYAQRTYSELFSDSGKFAGQTIDDVADALRAGRLSPADVPIEYGVRDGNALILNTRSSQALERAGIPRLQWKWIDITGDAAAEARLTGQLQRNNITSQGVKIIRSNGSK